MISVNVRGFECEFNDCALDDFEMLEKLEQMENGNAIAVVPFARGVFGDKQLAAIKEHLRGDNGVCKLSDMSDFIGEALQLAAKTKSCESKN